VDVPTWIIGPPLGDEPPPERTAGGTPAGLANAGRQAAPLARGVQSAARGARN